jgi:hypothetical protein
MCRVLLSSIQSHMSNQVFNFQLSRISANTLTIHVVQVEIRATKIVPCTYQWRHERVLQGPVVPVLSCFACGSRLMFVGGAGRSVARMRQQTRGVEIALAPSRRRFSWPTTRAELRFARAVVVDVHR